MKAFAAAGSFDVFSCGMRTRFDCIETSLTSRHCMQATASVDRRATIWPPSSLGHAPTINLSRVVPSLPLATHRGVSCCVAPREGGWI